MEPPAHWEEALAALAAPLAFAARNDYAHLDRIRDLEAALLRAARRAAASAPGLAERRQLTALLSGLPAAGAPRAARVQALRECWAMVRSLQTASRDATAPPPCLSTPSEPRRANHEAASRPAAISRPQVATHDAPDAAAALPPAASETAALPPAAAPILANAATVLPLHAPVQYLRGVGPKLAAALARRDVHTIDDLLHFFPRRYQPRSGIRQLADLSEGLAVSVEGDIHGVADRNMHGRRRLEVILTDGSGAVHLVWFRVPGGGFAKNFRAGMRLRATGVVKRYRNRWQMVHPETIPVEEEANAGPDDALIPLYLDVDGAHPNQLRRVIESALPAARQIEDPLPEAWRRRRRLPDAATVVQRMHQPPRDTALDALLDMQTPWQQRLIYDELLLLQLALLRTKQATAAERGCPIPLAQPLAQMATSVLPFALTAAQARVLAEIDADLRRPAPMQRLVQGDVGSGKTAVALLAALGVARAGHQTALLAPTELLAEQHARTALATLVPAGVRFGLLTGHCTASERRQVLAALADGEIQVLVGTHALIQDRVVFASLALGIVDEQHRFGVLQRARLRELGQASLGATPHMLLMTATPIPRTLALTVYGDLDVSQIDTLPPGRSPVRTHVVADSQRARVYAAVRDAVAQGRQVYVVFPLVEESDKEGMERLRDATSSIQELQADALAGLRLGLLHGRMHSDEKDHIMRAFAAGDLDVLIATVVIEVGIDVPNATIMVIENAERFGLSQLHQLRGRVGRGAHASTCFLLTQPRTSDDAWRRLNIMEQTSDGFKIAEADLDIRGPGDFIGTRQAGLPALSLANLARDHALLVAARQDAHAVLCADPDLRQPQHAALARQLQRSWDAGLRLAEVG